MKSLRSMVLLLVIGTGLVSTVVLTYFVQRATTSFVSQAEYQHAQDVLSTVYLGVESSYRSLLYYEDEALERRKEEAKTIVHLGLGVVENYYRLAKEGSMPEAEAKHAALEHIRLLRYNDTVGYIWVNDTALPLPKMLLHPIFPGLEGKRATDTRYWDALDGEDNLLARFAKEVLKNTEGYVPYRWAKPGADTKEPVKKMSYVRLFAPWNWVLGSGVYIDDIEEEVMARRAAMAKELQLAFSRVNIGGSGYMFMFSGNNNVLLHPKYASLADEELLNPSTGASIVDELKQAAQSGAGMLEYLWDKPPKYTGEFRFWKRAYVRHFKPLDWYIAASMYRDEIEQPGKHIRDVILAISVVFFTLAIAGAIYFTRIITRPLTQLTKAAQGITEESLHFAHVPVAGTDEVRQLGIVLRRMLMSISVGVQEKEKLLDTLAQRNNELLQANSKLREEAHERVAAQEALLVYRNYLQDIINSMPSELITITQQGEVKQWNTAAEAQTGISPEQAIGRQLGDVYPWLSEELVHIGDALESSDSAERSKVVRQCNGELCYGNITIFSMAGVGDVVVRVDDVTTITRIEGMMLQTEKMLSLGGLAAGMAHEVNNPLAGILQGAQNIDRRLSPELPGNVSAAERLGVSLESMHEYMRERKIFTMLEGITSSARRAADIVANMLEFSRKSDQSKQPCDLVGLVEKTVSLASTDYDLKKEYDFRQVGVQVNAEEDLPAVPCVATEIEQVLLNLFRNAAQAIAGQQDRTEPAQISVKLRKDGDFARIEVQDNGPGLTEELRKRIFEPFFTTKPKGVGTGLGLSVSYFIITQNHGGTFAVESVHGKGATFILRLPFTESEKELSHS